MSYIGLSNKAHPGIRETHVSVVPGIRLAVTVTEELIEWCYMAVCLALNRLVAAASKRYMS